MNCGKVIICVNNFVDLVDFSLVVIFPKSHDLFCVGKRETKYK